MRLDADRRSVWGTHLPLHRRAQQHGDHGARSIHVEDRRGPDLLRKATGVVGGGRRLDDRERVLQGSLQGAADGVRRRGAATARYQSRGERRMRLLRSEEHTSELQSLAYHVCRLLLEKKKNTVDK